MYFYKYYYCHLIVHTILHAWHVISQMELYSSIKLALEGESRYINAIYV